MSDTFKAVVIGSEDLKRTLRSLLTFSKRPRALMRDIAAVLEEQTEENFKAQGRPHWQALAASTVRARLGGKKSRKKSGGLTKAAARAVGVMKILQVSGQLAASVHSSHGDDFATIGASRPYARIHQLGGKTGRGRKVNMPARPYLPFTAKLELQPEAEKALLKVSEAHLQRAIQK